MEVFLQNRAIGSSNRESRRAKIEGHSKACAKKLLGLSKRYIHKHELLLPCKSLTSNTSGVPAYRSY